MNGANYQEPDFKNQFYGVNYDKLEDLKRKYDPDCLLYGPAGVGSEHFLFDGDGRVCIA
jgi:hypothetical protein